MDDALNLVGRIAGIVGILVCVFAVVLRLSGQFGIGSLSAGALLQVGTSGVVIGCFLVLLGRPKRS